MDLYSTLLRHECPHVASVVGPISTQLRNMATRAKKPQFCELEARLGRLVTDDRGRRRFESGVDEAYVAKLLCRLEASTAWTDKQPWTQIVDRFYLLPSGLQVRTSTEVTPDDDAEYITTHVIKTEVSSIDLAWSNADPKHMLGVHDVRVSVKHEEPLYEDELQERVDEMNLVRIKQRKSFRYTPAGQDTVRWSVDVTLVWQRASYLEALAAIKNKEPPLYEVELECCHPAEYLRSLGNNYDHVALSMALKIADLFEPATGAALASSLIRLCVKPAAR